MWSSVLALGLLCALDPVRLGVTLLVISRPRPVRDLFAYWTGTMIAGVPLLLVPLIVLDGTPVFKSSAQNMATSSTVQHIRLGLGVLALSIAALMTVHALTRRRQRAQLQPVGARASNLILDSSTPTGQDAPTEGDSVIRRLRGRARRAWENGSLWIPLVLGLGSPPGPDDAVIVIAIIVASGAAIGTQISAAIAFILVMLAAIEIILVSFLAAPAKTQSVLRLLHDWSRAHRRQVLAAMLAIVGVWLVAMA
jgi:hypothetical protein